MFCNGHWKATKSFIKRVGVSKEKKRNSQRASNKKKGIHKSLCRNRKRLKGKENANEITSQKGREVWKKIIEPKKAHPLFLVCCSSSLHCHYAPCLYYTYIAIVPLGYHPTISIQGTITIDGNEHRTILELGALEFCVEDFLGVLSFLLS